MYLNKIIPTWTLEKSLFTRSLGIYFPMKAIHLCVPAVSFKDTHLLAPIVVCRPRHYTQIPGKCFAAFQLPIPTGFKHLIRCIEGTQQLKERNTNINKSKMHSSMFFCQFVRRSNIIGICFKYWCHPVAFVHSITLQYVTVIRRQGTVSPSAQVDNFFLFQVCVDFFLAEVFRNKRVEHSKGESYLRIARALARSIWN